MTQIGGKTTSNVSNWWSLPFKSFNKFDYIESRMNMRSRTSVISMKVLGILHKVITEEQC